MLVLEMHEPPFTQRQAGLERKENNEQHTVAIVINK